MVNVVNAQSAIALRNWWHSEIGHFGLNNLFQWRLLWFSRIQNSEFRLSDDRMNYADVVN